MRTLSEILQAAGLQLEEGQVGALQAQLAQDYRSIGEVERKNAAIEQKDARISELEGQVTAMSQKVSEMEQSGGANDAKVAELQAQVAEFQKAEAERKQAEEDAKKRLDFEGAFTEALGGQEFANDFVRESVFEKAYRMHGENPAMGVKDIVTSITGDQAGIWKNPQQDPARMPKTTKPGTGDGRTAVNSLADLRGMSAEQINANWDAIKPILARGE